MFNNFKKKKNSNFTEKKLDRSKVKLQGQFDVRYLLIECTEKNTLFP